MCGALLQARLVDQLVLYQAPKLMGSGARGLFDLPDYTDMAEVINLQWQEVRQVGEDLKLTACIIRDLGHE